MNRSHLQIATILSLVTALLLTVVSVAVMPTPPAVEAQLDPLVEILEENLPPEGAELIEGFIPLLEEELLEEEILPLVEETEGEEISFAEPDISEVDMDCTPLQRIENDQSQIKCVISAPDVTFLVAEVPFPFIVTELITVSSQRSGLLGTLYPKSSGEHTIFVSGVDWGNRQIQSRMREIALDGLTFILQTPASIREVRRALQQPVHPLSLLSDGEDDLVFEEHFFRSELSFDTTLIQEGVSKGQPVGVLESLNLGLACYEKDPEECVQNLLDNL